MADLEQNFVQLQLMHESLSRFSESFASFLYGLNMNAFCVDFPEVPTQFPPTALSPGMFADLELINAGADTRVVQAPTEQSRPGLLPITRLGSSRRARRRSYFSHYGYEFRGEPTE